MLAQSLDELYEEGIEKESLFTYLCDLHENVLAIKIDGATKEDYVWGLPKDTLIIFDTTFFMSKHFI